MHFVIQKDTCLEHETIILKRLVENTKQLFNTYEEIFEKEIDTVNVNKYKTAIPVGDITFVESFLKRMYQGFSGKLNPIEIPKPLRMDEFLKREYNILRAAELPSSGKYFIKDANTLKSFSYTGEIMHSGISDIINKKDNPAAGLYVLSEIYPDLQSEWRIIVVDGDIKSADCYNGDPLCFPDSILIKKAVLLLSYYMPKLTAYSIDVMVGSRGTAIIEIHDFVSVGLYNTVWGTGLLYAYQKGIDYALNDNRKIEY